MKSEPAYKRLIKNVGVLSMLTVFNYVAPLLVLPYLTRTLSVEDFGAVMVIFASIIMASVVTDYGFGLSATLRVSKHRSDKFYINSLLARIFTAKIMLVIIAVVLVIFVSFLGQYASYRYLFWAGLPAIIGQAYQSLWLFHGLEKMKQFVLYMALSKMVYVLLIFMTVTEENDGVWVILSSSVSHVVGCLASLFMITHVGYKLRFSSLSEAVKELKESAKFFWSRLAVTVYTSSTSIIVSISGLTQAALYSSADQGYKAGQAVTSSLTQALYPYMAREKDWVVFYRVLALALVLLLVGTIVVGVNSEFLITTIFGEDYAPAVPVFNIMLVTLIVNFLGVNFGYPAMAAIDKVEWANKTVILAAAFFFLVVIGLYFLGSISAYSVSIAVLVTEVLVLISRLIVVLKHVK
jgi:PST family polysaccharide transporter